MVTHHVTEAVRKTRSRKGKARPDFLFRATKSTVAHKVSLVCSLISGVGDLRIFSLGMILFLPYAAMAEESVNLDNIVRAETDTAFRDSVKLIGGVGKLFHFREPTPIDKQIIIRMNRDTLYSGAIIDLSKPATIVLPDTGDRYISLQVINQDHHMYSISEPGPHELTQERIGSRYVQISIRIFVDSNNHQDIKEANAQQDKIELTGGGGSGPLELPDWNQDQLKIARQSLNALGTLGLDTGRAYGTKDRVDPIHYYVGAIAGWGGLPKEEAVYAVEDVENNDGTPHAVTIKDVPVDAFWSVTVYNSEGFLEKNDRDAYSFNNISAKPDENGAITIHFGGCEDDRVNCLPISAGWNYTARMYKPRKEIQDGSWMFPVPEPVE